MAIDHRNLNYRYLISKPVETGQRQGQSAYSTDEGDDLDHYVHELRRILETGPTYGHPPEPAQLLPGLFVGTTAQAENLKLLKRFKITHLLNCAGMASLRANRELRYFRDRDMNVEYEELPAENGNTYDMSHHFNKAIHFIDQAREGGGRVLVFCPDADRSGAIILAYCVYQGMALLGAAKQMKSARRVGMFNRGFMRQLATYARDRRLLEHDRTHIQGALRMPHVTQLKNKLRNLQLFAII